MPAVSFYAIVSDAFGGGVRNPDPPPLARPLRLTPAVCLTMLSFCIGEVYRKTLDSLSKPRIFCQNQLLTAFPGFLVNLRHGF